MLERTAAQSAALAEELRNVVRQAEKLVTALGEDREEAMVELRGHVSVALTEAKKRLVEFEDQARHFKETAAAAIDDYVRGKPLDSGRRRRCHRLAAGVMGCIRWRP